MWEGKILFGGLSKPCKVPQQLTYSSYQDNILLLLP